MPPGPVIHNSHASSNQSTHTPTTKRIPAAGAPAATPPPTLAPTPKMRKAIPLIIRDGDGKWMVTREAEEFISNIDDDIGAVVIGGPARTGKSFCANILTNKQGNFVVGHTMKSCTIGLTVDADPVECFDGTKFSTLIIDSEGSDAVTGSHADSTIMTAIMMCASVFIFNTKEKIDRSAVSNLAAIATLARSIPVTSDPLRLLKDLSAKELQEIMPKFICLIQSISLEVVNAAGVRATPTEFFEEVVLGKQNDDIGSVIRATFPIRSCVALPAPCERKYEKLLDKEWMKHTSAEYRSETDKFRRKVFMEAKPKIVCGKRLPGPAYVQFLKALCEAFNSGKVPVIGDTMKMWSDAQVKQCQKRCRKRFYRSLVASGVGAIGSGIEGSSDQHHALPTIVKDDHLVYVLNGQRDTIWQALQTDLNGHPPEVIEKARRDWLSFCDEHLSKLRQLNTAALHKWFKSTINSIDVEVSDGKHIVDIQSLQLRLNQWKSDYEKFGERVGRDISNSSSSNSSNTTSHQIIADDSSTMLSEGRWYHNTQAVVKKWTQVIFDKQHTSMVTLHDELRQLRTNHTDDRKTAEEVIQIHKQKCETLESQLNEMSDKLKSDLDHLQTIHTQKTAKLNTDIQEHAKHRIDAESKLVDLQLIYENEKRAALTRFEALQMEKNDSVSECQRLRSKCDMSDSTIQKQHEDISKLSVAAAEKHRLEDMVQDLKRHVDNSKRELDANKLAWENKFEEYRQRLDDELNEARSETSDAQSTLAVIKSERDKLRNQVHVTQEQLKASTVTLQKEVEKSTKLETVYVARLKKLEEGSINSAASNEARVEQLQSDINLLHTQVEQANRESQTHKQTMEREVASVNALLVMTRARNTTIGERLEQLVEENTKLQASQQRLYQVEAKLSSNEANLESARSDLGNYKAKCAALDEDLVKLRMALNDFRIQRGINTTTKPSMTTTTTAVGTLAAVSRPT